MIKSYSELMQLDNWQERLDYLFLGDNKIGEMTFGGHRHLNQTLYNSVEWKRIRRDIILRDNGCDMGISDRPIINQSRIIIHHINPISIEDLIDHTSKIYDPENLISVSFDTHQMIHYGTPSRRSEIKLDGNRTPNDTKLW